MNVVLSTHHVGDGGDEPPRHPPTVPGGYESAPPPNKRPHSKLLIVYISWSTNLEIVSPFSSIWRGTHFMLLASIPSTMFGILVVSYDNRFHHAIDPERMYRRSYEFLHSQVEVK